MVVLIVVELSTYKCFLILYKFPWSKLEIDHFRECSYFIFDIYSYIVKLDQLKDEKSNKHSFACDLELACENVKNNVRDDNTFEFMIIL